MPYLRLIGALALGIVGVASLSGLSCSPSSEIKPPPGTSVATGGAGFFGQGGTTSQDTGAGGVSTGGIFATTGGRTSCADTEKLWGNVCADTATSHEHCGECNQPCSETEVCTEGSCGCPQSNSDGDAGPLSSYTYCGVKCVDLLSDQINCGRCGKVCSFQRCINGECGCAATDIICPPNDACFDPMTDEGNCGECGRKCGDYEDCEQGECVQRCENHGAKDCGGPCFNVTNSSAPGLIEHCGDCGQPGPTDKFECKSGQCVCRAAAVLATVMHCVEQSSQAHLCVDTATDPRFCGSCDVACEGGKSCLNGKCECSATALQCPDGCFDGTSDARHCGSCDRACGTGFRCVASDCVCNVGLELCDGRCADGQNDPATCGGCGRACGAGQACTAGKCQCDAGLALCSGSCYDLQQDPAHCGTCENACSSSQSCIGGACACGGGLLACDKECFDSQNDALHCGGCDTRCSPTQMCQGGTCRQSIVKAQSLSQGAGGSMLRFSVAICNTTADAVNLAGYTMKYWYTTDGAATNQVPNISWAPPPFTTNTNPVPTAEFLPVSGLREKADALLLLTFASASLPANKCSEAIQIEIHPEGWAGSYSEQTTDYSYQAGTALKDNPNVTIYNPQGLIVWGVEPSPVE